MTAGGDATSPWKKSDQLSKEQKCAHEVGSRDNHLNKKEVSPARLPPNVMRVVVPVFNDAQETGRITLDVRLTFILRRAVLHHDCPFFRALAL